MEVILLSHDNPLWSRPSSKIYRVVFLNRYGAFSSCLLSSSVKYQVLFQSLSLWLNVHSVLCCISGCVGCLWSQRRSDVGASHEHTVTLKCLWCCSKWLNLDVSVLTLKHRVSVSFMWPLTRAHLVLWVSLRKLWSLGTFNGPINPSQLALFSVSAINHATWMWTPASRHSSYSLNQDPMQDVPLKLECKTENTVMQYNA